MSRPDAHELVLDFYGLREQPFGTTPDPRFTYLSKSYREALASICIGLQAGHGLLAIVAPPGLGKTMVLFHLLERLRPRARTVFLFYTQCNSLDLLRQILGQLDGAEAEHDPVAMHRALLEVLQKEQRLGRRVVVLVDEAHNLDAPVLETVRLLSDFETPTQKLLQIVLAGQPALAERLIEPEMAALTQRISILARIGPLTTSETLGYVRHRLKVGGSSEAPLFDEDALSLVAEAAKGVPREINTILSNALCIGRALGCRPIGRALVEEALEDRDLRPLCRGAELRADADPAESDLPVACAV